MSSRAIDRNIDRGGDRDGEVDGDWLGASGIGNTAGRNQC